jgi:hypothetical protein
MTADEQTVFADARGAPFPHPALTPLLEMYGDQDGPPGWLIDLNYEVIASGEPRPDSDERLLRVHPVYVGDNFNGACWVWVRVALSALI